MATKYAATLHNVQTMRDRGNEWAVYLPEHSQGRLFLAYKTESGAKLGVKRFKPVCQPQVLPISELAQRLNAAI